MVKGVAADMAAYVSKSQPEDHRRLRDVSPFKIHRVRPVRLSRGWYPGGLAEASRVVRSRWTERAESITATDWQVWRGNESTGEPVPLRRPQSVAEGVTPSGLALVTDNGPALFQAA